MATRLWLLGGAVLGGPVQAGPLLGGPVQGGTALDGPEPSGTGPPAHHSGVALPPDRRGALLAYLASEGGWVNRDRLALLFWPDSAEKTAKRNLRQLLLRVKRLALVPALDTTDSALRWEVECDVVDFRKAVAAGEHAAAESLYRGPFLAGFSLDLGGGVETWLETERDRLHMAFHGACMREAAAAMATADHGRAADLLARLLDLDPLAEDVVDALVRAHYLAGRRDAAMQVFERFTAALEVELGLQPLDDTSALIELVKRGDVLPVPATAKKESAGHLDGLLRPSRLAARDDDRRAIRSARAALIVLTGEPGVGKTALLRDLLPEALWCHAAEGLEQLPYHPLIALVRTRPDLAAGLGSYREDLARLVPEVAPDLAPAPLEPATAKSRLAEALALFVSAGGGPLVIDDLQWADRSTLETLVYLTGRGMRVYGAYRSGEASSRLLDTLTALRGRGQVAEIRIAPIPEQGVRSLVADLMGRSEGPPTFAKQLWHRCGGNPFFVLETLRSLFETGVLTADDRGWHSAVDEITLDYSELDVPPAVTDVIARRLARLPGRTVRVLEALALVRTEPDPRLLARVTGLSRGAVTAALDEATTAGLISAGSFVHDLLRQTLEQRIEPGRRQVLHALLAEALSTGADHGLVAEHWWRAGERVNARAAWLRQAAVMRAGGLQVDALAVLAQALERLPDGEDADWVRLTMAEALRESGRQEEAQRIVTQVRGTDRGGPELRFKVVLAQAWLHFHRGSVEAGCATLEQASSLARLVEDQELLLDHVLLQAQAAKETLHPERAVKLMEPVVARLRRARPDLRFVQFLSGLAALYDDAGSAAQALPLHLEALALAEALGSRYFRVEVSINLLFCYADLGRHDDAIAAAEGALGLGDYDNVPVLRINLAANYFQAGRFLEALGHYQHLVDSSNRAHLRLVALARSAECRGELGDLEAVPQLLDEVLAELQATDFPVALGAAAIAVYRFGDEGRVRRLRELLPDLSVDQLPAHQRQRLEKAIADRS